ncbi:MAG: hypothetical protein GY737_08170 [Desulfobacteraceae bacterium]|nr:hypothetical protein [Desulfobacteraceae bacterium]
MKYYHPTINYHLISGKTLFNRWYQMSSLFFGKKASKLSRLKSVAALSKKQVYHYENVLKPLLENVPCEGPVGMIDDEEGNWVSSCVHGGVIDDESLFLCYSEENFICQNCRHDVGKMV